MAGRLTRLATPLGLAAGIVSLTVASMALSVATRSPLALAPVGSLGVFATAYVARAVDPAVTLTLGVVLTPFAGNWQQLGIPGVLAPDRLLIAATIVLVVLRAVTGHGRPLPRPQPVHYVLALAVLWAVASALISHTLFQRASLLKIVEAYGAFPFLIFYLAPVIFTTPRQRQMLLTALVVLGAYLGLTVLFEMTAHGLVFPKYIVNASYGIHGGRGRGPFADAVANGFALYACALASSVAVTRWQGRARLAAGVVGALCFFGTFLTLERSVWIGVVVASVVTLIVFARLRRFVLPLVVSGAAALLLALVLIPGLSSKVQARASEQGPIWDRQNLTVAAFNMISARPLSGFGWSRFQEASDPYFQQSPDYPLTATGIDIHNYFLTYAVELGLPGLVIWLGGLLMGGFSTLSARAPPELEPWRIAFLALAICFLIVANSVPPTVFQNEAFWLWAGVVGSAHPHLRITHGTRL